MMTEGGLQAGKVARFESGDDLFVLGLLHCQALGPSGFPRMNPDDLQVSVHFYIGFGEAAVAGGLNKEVVKRPVVFLVALSIFLGGDPAAEFTKEAAEFRALLRRGSLDGTLGGEALEGGSEIEGFLDILCGQLGDKGPAARADFDQTLGTKLLDSLTHRGKGNP
jgi:hypothetical protein